MNFKLTHETTDEQIDAANWQELTKAIVGNLKEFAPQCVEGFKRYNVDHLYDENFLKDGARKIRNFLLALDRVGVSGLILGVVVGIGRPQQPESVDAEKQQRRAQAELN